MAGNEAELKTLCEIVQADAAQLVERTPAGFRAVSSHGYPPRSARILATTFPTLFTPQRLQKLFPGDSLPPSISTEPSQSFARSAFFKESVGADGFQDGLSHWLNGARLLHLSSRNADHFDDTRRRLVADVSSLATLLGDNAVAPRGFTPLNDWDTVHELLEAFRESGRQQLLCCWYVGRTLSRVHLWRTANVQVSSRPYAASLSVAELRVAGALVTFSTNSAMASHLGVSERTIHAHLRAMYRKLGVTGRAAAATQIITQGLFLPTPPLGLFMESAALR